MLLIFLLTVQPFCGTNIRVNGQIAPKTPIKAMEIPVFYITNRSADDKQHQVDFGKTRSDQLHYGYCRVEVPVSKMSCQMSNKFRELGWKPQEKFQKTNIGESVRQLSTEDEFLKTLNDTRKRTSDKKIVLFVHGYTCSFEKAVYISAKLALKIGAPVVVFAWASQNSTFAYTKDECNAEWSSSQLTSVLDQFGTALGNNNIILISHSMGARIVSWALKSPVVINDIPYKHIIFCSPDMDTDTFANCAKTITRASEDVQVFISCRDVRLRMSKLIHGNNRLGMCNHKLPEFAGMSFTKFLDHNPIGHSIPYDLLSAVINKTHTTTSHNQVGTN